MSKVARNQGRTPVRGPPDRRPPAAAGGAIDRFRAWFAARGWEVFPFQEEVWQAAAAGESGLLHAPTGAG